MGRSAKENKQTIHLGIFDTRIMFPVMFYTKSHGIKTLNVLTINCKSFNYNNLIKFIYIREKRQATRSDAFLKSFKCEGLNLSYNIYIYIYIRISNTPAYAPQGTQYDSCREAKLLLLCRQMLVVCWKYRTEDITVGYVAVYCFARLDLRMRISHCIQFLFVNRGSMSDGRN